MKKYFIVFKDKVEGVATVKEFKTRVLMLIWIKKNEPHIKILCVWCES